MLIATAGHIDHGKSSLVRALTGVETDRLPEEKARGISIDLGFAYWTPDAGPTIGFVDVPGHERFARNMIAGLSGIGFALLVVAADDGVMPQTVEHLRILDLLGISRGAVALTKCDKVDDTRIAQLQDEIADLIAPTGLAGAPIHAVSSITGQGIAALAAALLAARDARRDDAEHHFRLSVDRVFTLAGSGTVVTGTVLSGQAKIGDSLTVSPLGREVRLRGMQSGGRKVECAAPGERCALNLSGLEAGEVHRGDWIVAPAAHAPTGRIEARIAVLPDRTAPLRHDGRVHLHLGTQATGARVLVPRQRSLQAGAEEVVQLVLDEPALATIGQRFILRDASGRELVGGGRVLDPLAGDRRRSHAERAARVAALSLADPQAMIAALAAAPGAEPDAAWLALSLNRKDEAAAALCQRAGLIRAGKAGRIIVSPGKVERLDGALIAALAAHHRDHPEQGGLPRKTARARLGEPVSAELFDWLAERAATLGRVAVQGALLRLPGHSASFSAPETAMWRKVLALADGHGPRPFALADLARNLGSSEPVIAAMLQRRKASGDLWQITETRFMLREQVAGLVALAAGLDAASAGGFTAAEFRDASGIGRNFIIHLLEFLDRIGVTRRQGDARRMRADWQSVVGACD
ncbi:MAG: selenocysteine-specific translation elongation factor [Novosphingobium sp.]